MNTISKILSSELIVLDDKQIIILRHVLSYIHRNNLEDDYLPSELNKYEGLGYTPIECSPVEEKFPEGFKLLNKVLALYAMSDKGD